jgi:hypothetical protein
VGNQPIPQAVRSFGEDHLNRNGCELRDFATYNNLKITNTFFGKKDIHKYTWAARGLRSVIDYIIVNRNLSSQVKDTRVYRGSDIYSDHYLVITKISILARWRKQRINPRTNSEAEEVFKIHLLQQESIKHLYQTRLTLQIEQPATSDNIETEWVNIERIIKAVASEVLGRKRKDLRIWNEEMEQDITEKR